MSFKIMKDEQLDEQIQKEGYIVLPMLNRDELTMFRELYKKWHTSDPEEFYKSYFSDNKIYKSEVEALVLNIFASKIENYFTEYIAFGGMYVAKPEGEKGHFPPHQDWSFVDETKNWSLNMWCPLEDVNDSNGYLYVLPGSHRFNITIRGSGTPNTYDHLTAEILQTVKGIPMKAGECIFFYHGLVHGSTLNTLNRARVSVGLSLVQKNVPLLYHFYHEGLGKTEQFEIKDIDFYINYVSYRDSKPEIAESKGFIDFNYPRLTKGEFLEKTGRRKNFIKKLFKKIVVNT